MAKFFDLVINGDVSVSGVALTNKEFNDKTNRVYRDMIKCCKPGDKIEFIVDDTSKLSHTESIMAKTVTAEMIENA